MCGIITQIGELCPQDKRSAALNSLAHRGPDAMGEWTSPSKQAWLGHRRLSIVDLSPSGDQPMHNENKTIWLTANGEIYNYPSLRSRLEGLGHHFYSNSDNEAILHAYESWGTECLHHLHGMFAFVLWDEKKRRILAARDPVGIKPLYYAQTRTGLVISSELSAIIKIIGRPSHPDPLAAAYIMTIGYVPAPKAIWPGTCKLEPGHFLIGKPGRKIRVRRYWEPPRAIIGNTLPKVEQLQQKFEPVLKEHLLSDVPIGLFLSGGLDSTTIAAGLKEIGQPVEALTVDFVGYPNSEHKLAEETAAYLRLPQITIPVIVDDVNRLLARVAKAYDEPQGFSAPLPLFRLSQVTAERYKVALAGDGGDELFGGYNWYKGLDNPLFRHKRLKYKVNRPFARAAATPRDRQIAADGFAAASVLHRHAWRLFPRFLPEEAEALLSPLGVRFNDEVMLAPFRRHFEPKLPLVRALQRVDLMTFCTDSILAKVDKASMAHSLEVRVPWLDRRIVDWAFSSPIDPRWENHSKPLLRDYLHSRVPNEVLTQQKQGFSLKVLDKYDWSDATRAIEQGPWIEKGMWAKDWKRLLEPGVPYREARIWTLRVLTAWFEAWLE